MKLKRVLIAGLFIALTACYDVDDENVGITCTKTTEANITTENCSVNSKTATTVVTHPDGTKTTVVTVTEGDGNTTSTITNPDGSVVTGSIQTDADTGVMTITYESGEVLLVSVDGEIIASPGTTIPEEPMVAHFGIATFDTATFSE